MLKYLVSQALRLARYTPVSKVWAALVRGAVGLFGPKFAAWLTSFSIRYDEKDAPLVVCLSRASFVKDIRELQTRDTLFLRRNYGRLHPLSTGLVSK